MSARQTLLLAAATAVAGAVLRLATPVLPPDEAYRAVVAFYATLETRR